MKKEGEIIMKKAISLMLAVVMLITMATIGVSAEEIKGYKNAICTIETEDGLFLMQSGNDRGNALTVGETSVNWRFKEFAGGSYSMINPLGFAADVNGASMNEGVSIIQWTATGANNQRWMIEEAEDGYCYIKSVFSNLYLTYTESVVTQEAKDEEKEQLWKIEIVGEYEPTVEKMLESEAAKSLSEYKYERLCDFILSGGEFNLLTYDKIEKMIEERDYFNLPYEEQVSFVEECFKVEPTSLMYGSMATKLKKDIKVEYVGIEEGAWQSWHGIPEEEPRLYNITITDTESGDEHVVQYISPYDNDEEYAATVGEAIACFEMPIVKVLWRFVYTSMNTSSWNGGDGTIWNNTAYRGDVNNMVQMFAHELGHVMDNGRQDTNVWYRAIAQDMVPVTGYGNTNRWEDLAEFSRLYLLAKGDDARIEAIEKTYPARTKAYKALLYVLDNEFYACYEEEYKSLQSTMGDWDKSAQVMISLDGQYLTDDNGSLVFVDKKDVIKNWQTWEVYTQNAGESVFRNKATGKYITLEDGKATFGEKREWGIQSSEDGYSIIDSATGFVLDENLCVALENGLKIDIEEVGRIPYTGDKTIELSVNGEKIAFTEGEGLTMGNEDNAWTFVAVDKGYYLIMNKETGKVFDISGNSTENGASAILYSITGGENQHFKIVNNNDGTYKLQLRHSGLYLTRTNDGFCQSDGSMGYTNWIIK